MEKCEAENTIRYDTIRYDTIRYTGKSFLPLRSEQRESSLMKQISAENFKFPIK